MSISPAFTHFSLPRRRRFQSTSKPTSPTFARLDNNNNNNSSQSNELNLSVLRFTLGIRGFDESYLPRWIGYGFGSLLVLNHFATAATSITPPQLRTEALGLSLAAFSAALPYFGRFLKGSTVSDQLTLPEDLKQIFLMPDSILDSWREDLAWATYVLLRNTNSISVIISVQGELCVRGYWSTPDDVSKGDILAWFKSQLSGIGLSDLRDDLYFPQFTGSEQWKMLPKGTQSLLVQPIVCPSRTPEDGIIRYEGFVLLASNLSYAFSEKDRVWIRAIGNKFKGLPKNTQLHNQKSKMRESI